MQNNWLLLLAQTQIRIRFTSASLLSFWDQHGLPIISIIAVIYFMQRFGASFLTRLIKHTIRPDLFPTKDDREKRINTLSGLIKTVLRLGGFLVGAIMIMQNLGIETAPLLASAGVISLALGVGAQSLIKDFVAGVFIISENQYRLGDQVEIQGISGTVEAITVRTTVLRDSNGSIHHIPNGTITSTTNKSMGYGLINLDISVDAKTDLKLVEDTINNIGNKLGDDEKLKTKIIEAPHFGHIAEFVAAGAVIKILGKTISGQENTVKSAFFEQFKTACEAKHIKLVNMPKTETTTKKKA